MGLSIPFLSKARTRRASTPRSSKLLSSLASSSYCCTVSFDAFSLVAATAITPHDSASLEGENDENDGAGIEVAAAAESRCDASFGLIGVRTEREVYEPAV